MPTLAQHEQLIDEIKKSLGELRQIDILSLARKEELGSMSFESGLPVFERTLRLYREVGKVQLESVSWGPLTQLRDQAREAITSFKQIQEFSFARYPSNTQAQRDSLIAAIQDRYDREFQLMSPIISFGVRMGTDFERLEREAKEKLDAMSGLLQEQQKSKEETARSVKETLDEVRKLAREAGVSQHAELFSLEAKAHEDSASKWLTATIWVSCITLLGASSLLALSWFYTPSDLNTTRAVQIGIGKLAILSLLFSAVLWTGRLYRSHRHNHVVNRHRMNALRTFQTFVNATGDEATKNAVLIQATQCIFGPQATGYIAAESDANRASQILEIVRSAG